MENLIIKSALEYVNISLTNYGSLSLFSSSVIIPNFVTSCASSLINYKLYTTEYSTLKSPRELQ